MAGSFSKAFDESFNKIAPIAASGTFDLIRDKIKEDQAKADEKYKATTIMHSNIAMASQLPDKDMAKKIITITESVGTDPESQKNISEMIQKAMVSSSELKPEKSVFQVGSGGKLNQIGTVPGNAEVFKEPLSIEEIVARASGSAQARADVQASAPTAEMKQQALNIGTQIQNFNDAMKLLDASPQGVVSGNIALAKGAITGGKENTAGKLYSDIKPALSSSIYKDMTGDTRLSDADAKARAYPLFPKQGDDPKLNKLKADFIRQALEYRRKKYESGDFSPISQSQLMDSFVKYISNGGKTNFKPGDTQVKDGKTWVRGEDGKWRQKKS